MEAARTLISLRERNFPMAQGTYINLKRRLRTVTQSPKTSVLCACKKAELSLLRKYASSYSYHRPLGIDIELTNLCNLQCSWCDTQYYADKSVKQREIPFDKYKIIVPKLKGINRVMFCGGGESLTYKYAAEAVALTKEYVPHVQMHSNGVLLKGQRAEKLAQSGLDELRISIDGAEDETFRSIRGTALTPILENMCNFSKISDTPITTISVISKNNWRSLLDVPDVLRQVDNITTICFQPVEVDFLGWEAEDYYISRENLDELRDTVLEKCERYGLRTNIDAPEFDPLFFKPFEICEYPFFGYITLNYEGFVAPCCRLTNVAHMGDLKEQSFDEIWNGESFRTLREMMLEGTSYCHSRCNYRVKMKSKPPEKTPGRLRYKEGQNKEKNGVAEEQLLEIDRS